jgi:hypothetical protein
LAEVEAWSSVFAPVPTPPAKVELVGKTQVQLVEKPKPRAKAQSPAPLTEKQIQVLMGDVSGLTDLHKALRRYAVKKYRERWRDIDPAEIKARAKGDPEYEKEVGVAERHITTWRRALGRKPDRQK